MNKSLLVALLLGSIVTTAQAADQVPAGPATKQVLRNNTRVDGSVDFPQDVDWTRLVVTPGEDYVAVALEEQYDFTEIDILDANRRLIAKQVARNVFSYDIDYHAVKFIAPSTPLYLVYKIDPARGLYPHDPYPRTYVETLRRSCAHNSRTRCTAEVNVSHTSDLASDGDANWYRIGLKAGQTYTLTAKDFFTQSCDPTGGRTLQAKFGINDPSGKVVVKPSIQDGHDNGTCPSTEAPVASFKAAKTGGYYVVVTTAPSTTTPGQGQFTVRTGVVKATR